MQCSTLAFGGGFELALACHFRVLAVGIAAFVVEADLLSQLFGTGFALCVCR